LITGSEKGRIWNLNVQFLNGFCSGVIGTFLSIEATMVVRGNFPGGALIINTKI
jgi:hypothetical protein